MRRGIVAALLPLALGGCLPLPITIASTAFSGISYLTSGKSTTDHVLSATMEQDCALTRPVFGEPFCRDVGPDGEGRTPAVTVAYYPGDRDVLSNDERLESRHRGALQLSALTEEARQIAAAPQFLAPPPRVSVAGIVVTKDQIVPADEVRTLPVAASGTWAAAVPVKTIEVAPLAAPVPSITKAPEPAPGLAPVPAPGPAADRAAVSPPAAPTKPATAEARVQSGPQRVAAVLPVSEDSDRWVVLGSFRDIARAKVMASRYADRTPEILEATVEGGVWHRVAVGPLTPAAARDLRDGLGRVDGRKPWVVRLASR